MELTIFTFLFTVVTFFVVYKLLFWPKKNRNGLIPPGPKGWPIFGSALDITAANMSEKLSEFSRTYGSIFQMRMFNVNTVCLNSADVIRKAFGENPYQRIMSDRGIFFYAERFLHGSESVGLAREGHGALHNGLKKGLVKALNICGDGIEDFEGNVQTELCRLVSVLDGFDGQDFEVEATLKRSISNLISVLLSGHTIPDEHASLFWDYDKSTVFFFNPIVNSLLLKFPFLLHIPGRFRTVYLDLINAKETIKVEYIDKQMETYTAGKIRGVIDSLIAQKMEDEKAGRDVTYTYERIVDEAIEIVTLGILTTLSSLCNLILCLLHHPEYQQKIQEELDTVVGRNRQPNISDKAQCPVTEAVLMESMRYITTVPSFPHECAADINFEGYSIEKGSTIIANVDFVHHDEKVWGDPWTFRPERFIDDQGQLLHRSHVLMKSWLPFGVGIRHCPGELFGRSRMFLYVATLFLRYNFEPVDGNLRPCDCRQKEHFQVDANIRAKQYSCRAVRRPD